MSFKSFCSFSKILFFLILLPESVGFRDVNIITPKAAERGRPVVIRCLCDLENEDLYQIEWYRGEREFCRYAPREEPPLQIFPTPGIEVDLLVRHECSYTKQLTISAATRGAQGGYTCEVSADAQMESFFTARSGGFMYVVDLPKSPPDLIWTNRRYKSGMKIKADCISYDSMPPRNLSFFINSVPIRCAATIYTIYHSHQQLAHAGIRTTIAPVTWTQKTTAYPQHRISENSASWNRKILWPVCSLSVILYGQHSVG